MPNYKQVWGAYSADSPDLAKQYMTVEFATRLGWETTSYYSNGSKYLWILFNVAKKRGDI